MATAFSVLLAGNSGSTAVAFPQRWCNLISGKWHQLGNPLSLLLHQPPESVWMSQQLRIGRSCDSLQYHPRIGPLNSQHTHLSDSSRARILIDRAGYATYSVLTYLSGRSQKKPRAASRALSLGTLYGVSRPHLALSNFNTIDNHLRFQQDSMSIGCTLVKT